MEYILSILLCLFLLFSVFISPCLPNPVCVWMEQSTALIYRMVIVAQCLLQGTIVNVVFMTALLDLIGWQVLKWKKEFAQPGVWIEASVL